MPSHDIAGHETLPGPFFPTNDTLVTLPVLAPMLAPAFALMWPFWQFQMAMATAFVHGFADKAVPDNRVTIEDACCAALVVPDPVEEDGEHALFA